MTLSQRLEIRQSQSLVMTPRLQQALRMLRMSHLELAEHVAGVIEANPLLEARPPARFESGPPRLAERLPDTVDLAPAEVSLRDHLRWQIGSLRREPPVLAAAVAVIEELDDDGYLRVPLDEIAARHRLDPATVSVGLALVQECEPSGIGARDLKECLRLQLRDQGLLDRTMLTLLDGLDLLTAGRRPELAAQCDVSLEGLAQLLRHLQRLDPRPGAGFGAAETAAVVVPDVFVWSTQLGWKVELNTETLPRVLVNNAYAAELSSGSGTLRAYVSECRAQAVWLVRSLEQRARTILAVASAIVSHQEPFFATGSAGLRPLSRRALAQKLGVHESTISRVTANKYLACDRGTFEMRFFFSQAIPATEAAGGAVSATAVQSRIRALIQAEAASATLSDDSIVAELRREGIDIARRTVAKYREGLGIPSSFTRRRLKSVSATG